MIFDTDGFELDPELGPSKYPYWRTKVGNFMRIEDMTDQHLRNALTMCIRDGHVEAAGQLAVEYKARGLGKVSEDGFWTKVSKFFIGV